MHTVSQATSPRRARLQLDRFVLLGLRGLVALALAMLVVVPMIRLLLASVEFPSFTVARFLEVFRSEDLLTAIWNSLALGFLCGASSVAVGAPLAWLIARTDLPGRSGFRLLVLSGFVAPGFVNALAWILLAGPNAGLINKAWMTYTGLSTPLFNIFSMTGLFIVSFATIYPLAFILIYNAFQLQDTEIDEAARILGAKKLRVLFTVTLPLALPAIVMSFVLCMLEAMILYGAPAVIGSPAGIPVITTALFVLFEYPPQLGLAAALSVVLLTMMALLLWFQHKALQNRVHATFRGKGGRMKTTHLGIYRWPLFIGVLILVAITVVAPYAVIVATAFLDRFHSGLSWSNLTLNNFDFVLFRFASGPISIKNSVVTGGLTAALAVIIGGLTAFFSARQMFRWPRLIEIVTTAPIVIPGMTIAIAVYGLYNSGPIVLSGTLTILVLVYLSKFLPLAFNAIKSSLTGIHLDLENAARILGASRLRSMLDVTLPLVRAGVFGAFILVFIPAIKELSASVLLYNSRTTVIATAIMDAYSLPSWEAVAALSTILLVLNALVIIGGFRLLGSSVLGRSN